MVRRKNFPFLGLALALFTVMLVNMGATPHQDKPPQPFGPDAFSGRVLVQSNSPPLGMSLFACIDDAKQGPLAHWLSQRTGLPLVKEVGYPTPGSFGTWGAEQGIGVVTYEFPLATTDAIVREHVPVLVDLLTDSSP